MTPCFFCVICLSICTVCHDMPDEAMLPSSSHNSSTSGTIMQGCGFCGRFFVSILFFDFCIVFSLFFVSMCKQGVYMQKSPKTGLCFFWSVFFAKYCTNHPACYATPQKQGCKNAKHICYKRFACLLLKNKSDTTVSHKMKKEKGDCKQNNACAKRYPSKFVKVFFHIKILLFVLN